MEQRKEIGILGVGNILLRDEGFGIHVVWHLQRNYLFPETVEIMDGGTAGIMLGPFFEGVKRAVVIDAVSLKDEPGTIHIFSQKDLRAGKIQTSLSPHQVGIVEIIELCRLRDLAPDQFELIGVVPKDLSPGTDLSPALRTALGEVTQMVINTLSQSGLAARPIRET